MDAVTDIAGICSSLVAGGYSVRFRGFSAIDLYLRLPALPFLRIDTDADIAELARFIENLRFPGVEIADAAVDFAGGTLFFRCLDRDEQGGSGQKADDYSFPLLSFSYDWQTRRFLDPLGLYPLLRKLRDGKKDSRKGTGNAPLSGVSPETVLAPAPVYHDNEPCSSGARYRLIMDTSLAFARYDFGAETPRYMAALSSAPVFQTPLNSRENSSPGALPGPELERAFLSSLLVSPRPDRGLEFLKRTGFLQERWPELACYDEVDHSKEFHPEGNVWNHTLETFQHRKPGSSGAFDLRLSLGLLLHDAGKPVSAAQGNHRFSGHAELGARAAARFLERLEFEPPLVEDIFYLVKNHMLPAALKRLPLVRTGEIMASPLFPTLMELYRCDESSSFKGLEGYYENSAAYQSYLRNIKNPYRSADGKKIGLQNQRARYRAR